MAEEQAIPEAVQSEADAIACDWVVSDRELAVLSGVLARALLAAELRGRQQQKEADARICDDIGENGGNDGYFDWPAQCATAIRSQPLERG